MTECERIIKEKILPETFFEEEVQCGFLVDSNRKKSWAIQLDLLLTFDKFCKEHNLTYYLIYGSLLGAIRHHGFIPWDDDIDLGMPRADYERLCEIGKEGFSYPYFFQTPETDPGYYFSLAKLRNSNTTCISYAFRYENFNQGIGIDIFPMDKCVMEDGEKNYQRINRLILENSSYMRKSNPNPTEADKERIANCCTEDPMENCKEIHRIASQHEQEDTPYIGVPVCTIENWDKQVFLAKDFAETIEWDFHGFKFPVPKNYHGPLEVEYGDYMQFPPVEDRGTWHNSALFDPDIPYKEFKKIRLGIEA